MKSKLVVWNDGKLIKWENAKVHVFSHALSRGSAIFEVLTAEQSKFGTVLFRPAEHMRRMLDSARYVGMKLPYTIDELVDAMKTVVKASKLPVAVVKVVALWPSIEFEVIPHNRDVSVFIVAAPYANVKVPRKKPRGLKASLVSVRKLDPSTVPIKAKVAANYLNGMLAKMEAIKHGADVPIILDTKGYIAEGATESLFVVKNGKLYTPSAENILSGITRDSVIQLAKDWAIPVVEKRLKPDILDKADEIFFTASIEKIMSVGSVNNKKVGNGDPGPMTKALLDYFDIVVFGYVPWRCKWLVPVK